MICDSSNWFSVRRSTMFPYMVVIDLLPLRDGAAALSRDQALNLSAWLAVIADPDGLEFEELANAICGYGYIKPKTDQKTQTT